MENLSSFLGKMPYRGLRGPQPGSERPDPQAGAAGSQGGTTRRLQETGLSHDFRARQSLPADLEMEGCSTRETRAARRRLFPTAAVAGSCRLRPGKGGPAALRDAACGAGGGGCLRASYLRPPAFKTSQ